MPAKLMASQSFRFKPSAQPLFPGAKSTSQRLASTTPNAIAANPQ
ncbi:MAG: hypothetical protein AB1589_19725 [Cyanobacteriota bacterium]